MEKKINLVIDKALGAVSREDVFALEGKALNGIEQLHNGTGLGSDFLGWLHLPTEITEEHLQDVENAARKLQSKCEIVVVIGIGGSYLGAKAVIEALSHSFEHLRNKHDAPIVLFAGQNIGEDYLFELQELLADKQFGIVVISKSGTTTEPAIAFRLLKEQLEKQVGKAEAGERIVAVTDASRGALRKLADTEGYKTFVIADNVGGRFSVLSPVGLLPIAIAGYDIRALVAGAVEMEKACGIDVPFEQNPAAIYAATRNALYQSGKKIEILANFNPKLHFLAEWWKQLYGESEGKDGKGILPHSVTFTTDLHSMGQYIQDGERIIMETVLKVNNSSNHVNIPYDEADGDGLNYLQQKTLTEINHCASEGTAIAHVDGGVPVTTIEMERINEEIIGQLFYMMEYACGVSGYILKVNPFDQPGVEAYKRNMFHLLGKKGY